MMSYCFSKRNSVSRIQDQIWMEGDKIDIEIYMEAKSRMPM